MVSFHSDYCFGMIRIVDYLNLILYLHPINQHSYNFYRLHFKAPAILRFVKLNRDLRVRRRDIIFRQRLKLAWLHWDGVKDYLEKLVGFIPDLVLGSKSNDI